MSLSGFLSQLLQLVIALVLAPLLLGWVNQCRAWLQNKSAPSLLLPYRMIRKLLHKDAVVAENASGIFRTTPYVVFGAMALAAAIVPSLATDLAFAMVSLAENARVPVDNPATHLELTMIHEAMILEYSARHLALIEWASALKLFNYACIGLALFLPYGIAEGSADWLAIVGATPVLVFKLLVGGFALALIETLSAKMRIFRAPEFLGTAFLMAVLAMLVNLLLGS